MSQQVWNLSRAVDKACKQLREDWQTLDLVVIANSSTPPNVEVVDDHTKRVIDSLLIVIADLREAVRTHGES